MTIWTRSLELPPSLTDDQDSPLGLPKSSLLPVEPIEEEPLLQDLLEAIEFGNHKSATKDAPKLLSIFGKEVEKGWQLTLPISTLQHLPGAVVGPVGIVSQDSINAFGHRLPKDRPIHNQSFSFGSGQSLNNRVIEDEHTPCRHCFALLRFIHKIAALRAIYPAARILLLKSDFKSAYRRVHFRAELALQSCIKTKGLVGTDLGLVSLRTTFGGSPCPSIFGEISETVTDLANAIIRCSDYDPASFPSHYSHLLGLAKVEPNNVPLDADSSGDRGAQAALLALDVLGQPLLPDNGESLPRDEVLAINKAIAEGTPAERLIVLGLASNDRPVN